MLHDKISGTFTVGRQLKAIRVFVVIAAFLPFAIVMNVENKFRDSIFFTFERANSAIREVFKSRYEEMSDSEKDEFEQAEEFSK